MAKGRKAPRRGASRAQPAARRKGIPGWLWLVSGLVIGLFVAFLFQLEPGHDNVKRSPPPPKPVNAPAKPAPAQQPTYDFYTLLPESEVVVPQNTGKVEPPATPADPDSADDKVRYYLQAGSFKQQADADKVRAQILLLGMDVHLESAKLNDGQTWHRVQVGPFKDKSSLAQAQSTLSGNGFQNLLPQQRTQ
ncbi:SPOR domain-containing protein [Halopseudomonas sabulinigri]|uniref:SPOR domain-containing protein n=1 Tax=Halopseudomonas sabulinigri TaxID=472181 RepID=A0ABP9ZT15_9GAMM